MKISISQPCYENWNEMIPEEKGRFCLSCQKCVYDFTKMSDDDVLDLLQKPNQCGRFSQNQLDRINLKFEQEKRFQFPRFIKYYPLLLSLGFGGNLIAQEKGRIEILKHDNIQELSCNNDSITFVSGKIEDADGFPIPEALVILKHHRNIRGVSDSNGDFRLSIPRDIIERVVIISSEFGDEEYDLSETYINKIKINTEGFYTITETFVVGGAFVEVKKRNLTGKVLHTLAWPFRQIGKIF